MFKQLSNRNWVARKHHVRFCEKISGFVGWLNHSKFLILFLLAIKIVNTPRYVYCAERELANLGSQLHELSQQINVSNRIEQLKKILQGQTEKKQEFETLHKAWLEKKRILGSRIIASILNSLKKEMKKQNFGDQQIRDMNNKIETELINQFKEQFLPTRKDSAVEVVINVIIYDHMQEGSQETQVELSKQLGKSEQAWQDILDLNSPESIYWQRSLITKLQSNNNFPQLKSIITTVKKGYALLDELNKPASGNIIKEFAKSTDLWQKYEIYLDLLANVDAYQITLWAISDNGKLYYIVDQNRSEFAKETMSSYQILAVTNKLRCWDIVKEQRIPVNFPQDLRYIKNSCFALNDKNQLFKIDLENNKIIETNLTIGSNDIFVAISHNGNTIATQNTLNNNIKIRSIENKQINWDLPSKGVKAIGISTDGKFVVAFFSQGLAKSSHKCNTLIILIEKFINHFDRA